MKRISSSGSGVTLAAATAFAFPPTSFALVPDWLSAAGAVPEFDLEIWAAAATNVTVAELLVAMAHPGVIADDDFTTTHAAETLTAASHGLGTGDGPIRLTNSGGALPAGFATATDYWVIRVDANTMKLAASRADAFAGTAVAITGDGTGTHTLVDTASTEIISWHSAGFVGTSAGAITLTARKGWVQRFAHRPGALAYGFVATLSAAETTTIRLRPILDV